MRDREILDHNKAVNIILDKVKDRDLRNKIIDEFEKIKGKLII